MVERQPFGSLLKRYRLAAGLTHEALAERTSVGVRTISDLERGVSRAPRRYTLALLIDALALTPEQRAALEAAARSQRGGAGPVRPHGNLPVQLTSFVGRTQEVRLVVKLIHSADVRLVTLTGPGGVGKTRLAVQAAAELIDLFPEGVFSVALASVTDGDGIIRTITRVLDADAPDGPASLEYLIDRLGDREILLLIDNFEHLLAAAPLLTALLQRCPRIKMLVTSRASLRLSGEQELPVAPLAVPDSVQLPPVEKLLEYPVIRLFMDRAMRVRPDLTLTDENAPTIIAICDRLDGLPLAVEIAAARTKTLSPAALLARLNRESGGAFLRLLANGPRDLPFRQQTLRDTIAWSYDLLTVDEQRLFRGLAVFSGGSTLEATEAVCGFTSQEQRTGADSGFDVLEGLTSLLDKSLLYRNDGPDGEPRFLMLETIREFALERLSASGEETELRRRHASHYLAIVESTGALLFAREGTRNRLSVEQDNIQAALRWLVQHA